MSSNELRPDIDDSLEAVNRILEETTEKTLSTEGIATQLNILLGDILTIVDASFQDVVQRKAVKDLVKQKFYSRMDWIAQLSDPDMRPVIVGESHVVPTFKNR